MLLTKEELKNLGGKFDVKHVTDEELGIEFYVRELTTKEFDRCQMLCGTAANVVLTDRKSLRAQCVSYFLCDENGNRLFGDHEVSQIEGMSGKLIDRIFTAGYQHAGIGDLNLDDAEKNSATAS